MKGLLNLLVNIVIPVFVLSKLTTEIGPAPALILALAFPLTYGVYEIYKEKKTNVLSVIGVISVLLTGGLGLLQVDPKWIALKEAAVPFIIMILILVTMHTKFPIINKLLINDTLLKTELIKKKLNTRAKRDGFNRSLKITNYIVAFAFLVSTVLNYVLAKIILQSTPGTDAFNAELARMTALSYPVIALPSMVFMVIALFYLLRRLNKLTGLKTEEFMRIEE